MHQGEIRIKNETLSMLGDYVLTRGVPLPPEQVKNEADVCIRDAKGHVLPSAAKVLQRRRDGSVEWMLMDILLQLGRQESTSIFVEPRGAKQRPVANPVMLRESGKIVKLSNGISEVVLCRDGGSLIRRLLINGRVIVDEGMLVDLQVVDPGGKIYRASLGGRYTITVPHHNPLRTQLRIDGKHAARDGTTLLDFSLRFTLTAGRPDLTIEHTFYCRENREGKIPVKAIRLVMPTTMDGSAHKLLRQAHHGKDWTPRDVEIAENIEVVASTVADIDSYATQAKGPGVSHPCGGGSLFLRNLSSLREDWSIYPFHMRPGQGSGFRADLQLSGMSAVHPIIGWQELPASKRKSQNPNHGSSFTLATTFEHFRQLHPKSIAIDENVITWSIWPEWATPMQLVQGVSKSHIIYLTGEPRRLSMHDLQEQLHRWEYGYVEPVDASFDPAWPAFCQVLDCQHLLKYQPEKYPLLENLLEAVPAAGNPARWTYDRHPAQGMFHFGDIINADATACQNNEDDINVFFPLQHFLRTGHTYAWDHGKEAARHYMEVDFCQWSTDPRQKGGLIPHTGQHFIGNVYPSHQWAEGILAYYYLSGDERARDVVIACGDNNVWWAYHNTKMVCADGREAGMPLINLAAAYRLTGDGKYIDTARHIIKNFFLKWTKKKGRFMYPYPQGLQERPVKFINGYGDWSSFAGLYRLWEVTGKEEFRKLGVVLLKEAIQPGAFSLNDARGMDFLAAWALGRMTGDMENVIQRVRSAIPMLLRRGGHPLRRLHFLKELDERGLIDDKDAGNRPGAI